MYNLGLGTDMPMGLGMALSQNIDALNIFSNMTDAQQKAVFNHTHAINSKAEMRDFVQQIAQGETEF